jgi:hypothetical protein
MIKSINVESITSITFSPEEESKYYRWMEEIPAKPRKFLGIRFGTIPSIPAGWSIYEHGMDRKPSSDIEEFSWYRVDEKNKKVFVRPKLYITFGYKEAITKYFDSNEEAEKYKKDLIMVSGKSFTK